MKSGGVSLRINEVIKMNSAYIIVQYVEGACGHGTAGIPYISLMNDGGDYAIGRPLPVFIDKAKAEQVRKKNDRHGFYKVIEINIIA